MRAFVIEGEPQGKGRARHANGHEYTPEKTVLYENLVKMLYWQECGKPMYEKGVPLVMHITAFYGIPNSVSNKKRQAMLNEEILPTKKPDIDNLCKVIMDSLNKVAYYDDAQIVKGIQSKFYSDYPRVFVQIWTYAEYKKIYGRI